MNTFSQLWKRLAKSKKYREEFVAAQLKRGIPFQIRTLLKRSGLSQEDLASRASLTQGVVSRAANPEYGNLTLNTLIRIAAGFDVAFIGKFVPFSELVNWFADLSEESIGIKTFAEEDREFQHCRFEHNLIIAESEQEPIIEEAADGPAKAGLKQASLQHGREVIQTEPPVQQPSQRRKQPGREVHVGILAAPGGLAAAQARG